jgi:ribonuclease-3
VLGLAIAEHIFCNSNGKEKEMARMYAAFVCAEACHKIALKIGLDKLIRTADKGLQTNKTVLSDGVEAVLGCVFIDGGFDVARRVVLSLWQEIFANYSASDQEPKTRLQEISQEKSGETPVYEVVSMRGPAHDPIFQVSVTALGKTTMAEGNSKKTAETKAARALIGELLPG